SGFNGTTCINALYQRSRRRLVVEKPDLVTEGESDGSGVVKIDNILFHNQIAAAGDAYSHTLRQVRRIGGVVHVPNHISSYDHLTKQWRENEAVGDLVGAIVGCVGRAVFQGSANSNPIAICPTMRGDCRNRSCGYGKADLRDRHGIDLVLAVNHAIA